MILRAARRPLLSGILLLPLILVPVLAAAALHSDGNQRPSALPESQYWAMVDSSLKTVVSLRGRPDAQVTEGLSGLAAQWAQVTAVTTTDNHSLSIDNSHLLSEMRAPNPDLAQIQNDLESLQVAHRLYPARIFSASDLASLKAILARPEFAGLNQPPNPAQNWLQNLWDRFAKWLDALLNRLRLPGPNINIGSQGWSPLALIATLILVLILALAARSMFADFIAQGELDGAGPDADRALTSDTAFQRAQSLSRGGDYRSAVRYLYLSSLLYLDERGVLRYDHAKTNREVLRSVADSPTLSQPLRDVINVFDDVWYGFHSMDEDSFRRFSRRVEELKEKEE
jgi:hypothetical protein